MEREKEDYKVNFSGATLSKSEGNRVGFSFILGIVALVVSMVVFGVENKKVVLPITIFFAIVGFCLWPRIKKE